MAKKHTDITQACYFQLNYRWVQCCLFGNICTSNQTHYGINNVWLLRHINKQRHVQNDDNKSLISLSLLLLLNSAHSFVFFIYLFYISNGIDLIFSRLFYLFYIWEFIYIYISLYFKLYFARFFRVFIYVLLLKALHLRIVDGRIDFFYLLLTTWNGEINKTNKNEF